MKKQEMRKISQAFAFTTYRYLMKNAVEVLL